jgi:hypothetical protein
VIKVLCGTETFVTSTKVIRQYIIDHSIELSQKDERQQNAQIYAAHPNDNHRKIRNIKMRYYHEVQAPPAAHQAIISPSASPRKKADPRPSPGVYSEKLTEQDVESYIKELVETERQDAHVAQVAVQWLEKKQAITSNTTETDTVVIQKALLEKAKEKMFQ